MPRYTAQNSCRIERDVGATYGHDADLLWMQETGKTQSNRMGELHRIHTSDSGDLDCTIGTAQSMHADDGVHAGVLSTQGSEQGMWSSPVPHWHWTHKCNKPHRLVLCGPSRRFLSRDSEYLNLWEPSFRTFGHARLGIR